MRLLAPLILALGCSRAPTVEEGTSCALRPGSAVSARIAEREAARAVFSRECGECHTRGSPDANPKALAIFDLAEEEWAAHMTEAQLANAAWRLSEPLNEHAGPREVSQAARDGFDRYRRLELASRSHACGQSLSPAWGERGRR